MQDYGVCIVNGSRSSFVALAYVPVLQKLGLQVGMHLLGLRKWEQ